MYCKYRNGYYLVIDSMEHGMCCVKICKDEYDEAMLREDNVYKDHL